jgi:hypothetical protein
MKDSTATETDHRAAIARSTLFCSPPRLPSDTRFKQLADHLLPTGRAQWVFFGLVWVALALRPNLGVRPGLMLAAVATFAGASWCIVNFWRCREAHCAVSGPGWAMLGALVVAEAVVGRSLVGGTESILFIAVLIVAYCFEFAWRARHGTNALTH